MSSEILFKPDTVLYVLHNRIGDPDVVGGQRAHVDWHPQIVKVSR
jgi:hypothetical protein